MNMIWTRYHVELAVEALRDLDLVAVDLRGADLWGADLRGAKGIACLYVPGLSSRGDHLYAVKHDETVMIKAGCWWGSLEAFKLRVIEEKGVDHLYIAAAELLAKGLIAAEEKTS